MWRVTPASRNVSRTVRVLLADRGMDQNHLATLLGMDKATLSRALTGHRAWKLDDIEALAAAFDLPVSYFFEPADTILRKPHFLETALLVQELGNLAHVS